MSDVGIMKAFAKLMSKKISKKAKKVLKEDLSNLGDFSDEEIAMLCNYGKALQTGIDFDDEVERELEKLEEEKARKQCWNSLFRGDYRIINF